jgi:cytochrome P450
VASRPPDLLISRYKDVSAALRDPALKPDHEASPAVRSGLFAAFQPNIISTWAAEMDRFADELQSSAGGRVDLVEKFLEPFCLRAAFLVTGVPEGSGAADLARIVSDAAADPHDVLIKEKARAANAELESLMAGSALPMAGPAFVAVSRTVACLLANAWFRLLRQPDEMRELRQHPESMARCVEEMLRVSGIPQKIGRVDAERNRIALMLASANTDDEAFAEPEKVDLMRLGPAHLALGTGMHSCAGAALIRMLMSVATSALMRRYEHCELAEEPEWTGGAGFRSPVALWVNSL